MRLAGVVDADLLDFMMGHVVRRYPTVSDVYDAEYVRKEYSIAEPFLTVLSPLFYVGATISELSGIC